MICINKLSVVKEKQNLRAFEEHFNISFTRKTCKRRWAGMTKNVTAIQPLQQRLDLSALKASLLKTQPVFQPGILTTTTPPEIVGKSPVTQAHTSSSIQQPQPAEPCQLSSPPVLTVVSLQQLPTLPFHHMPHSFSTKSFK